MKYTLVLIFALSCAFANAQYFEIQDYAAIDHFDDTSNFPIVLGTGGDFEKGLAADNINTYLQYSVLQKIYGKDYDSLFSKVFPPEGEFWGQAEFDYDVTANNERFFSITISYSSTGAYTEYYDDYYSFDATTGAHITLDDLFTYGAQLDVGEMVNQVFTQEIHEFLITIDTTYEEVDLQRTMYEECLERFDGDGFPSNNFWLTDSSLVVTAERCSNHMMAALDDIWTFSHEMALDGFDFYFTENGRSLISDEISWDSKYYTIPNEKVLTGEMLTGNGGNANGISITGIVTSAYGDFIHLVYWYDKYKVPISLSGSLQENGTYEFWEEHNGKKIARLELMYQNRQLMGVWEKVDGSNSYPFVLRAE